MSRFFPTLMVWSPILFLQVVKAETEFGVVLNHLIKATVVVLGVVWIIRTFWPQLVEESERESGRESESGSGSGEARLR